MKLAVLRLSALSALTALTMGAAQAGIINFIDLTENTTTGLGESAWTSLSQSTDGVNVTIKGFAGNTAAFAYLDWVNAGLGVCKKLNGAADINRKGNKNTICDPSNDDNTTVGEALSFVFSEDVFVKMWFNNNHDGGFDNGDKVSIAGTAYNVSTGYATSPGSANGIGYFQVPKGFDLRVAYFNEEFYMSGMDVVKNTGGGPPTGNPIPVPEPASLALAGLALLGLAATRRRRG